MELRVRLRGIKPPIWRRVAVPADSTLDVLHEILQIAFGWTNAHLHCFNVGTVRFGMADVEADLLVVDECHAPIGALARKGDAFLYEYDFGDDWEHEVLVEDVYEKGIDVRVECIDGARAAPPEDCGGVPGYENVVAALTNPEHPERREIRTWVGRAYDPEKFDVARVNKKLAAIEKRLARARNAARPIGRRR